MRNTTAIANGIFMIALLTGGALCLDLDELSPREAHIVLDELQRLARPEG